MNRRGLLFGFGALLAAPSIVRVSSLMAIKPLPVLQEFVVTASYTADDVLTTTEVMSRRAAWYAEWERVVADFWPTPEAFEGFQRGDTFTIEGVYRTA